MPNEPVTAAIGGILGIGGNLIQNLSNKRAAARQRDWNQSMMYDQRIYDKNMWHQQNAYNSPQRQMQRFEDAGLNPHLIYGKGTPGQASSLKSPDVKPYNRAENQSLMTGVTAFQDYYRFKNLEAQTDNTNSNTEVQDQQALLLAQKTASEVLGLKRGKLSFQVEKQIANYQVEAAKLGLEKTMQDIRKSMSDADVAVGTQENRIKIIEQQFKNEVSKGKNIDLDSLVKAYEAKLNAEGITKSDSVIWRWIAELDKQRLGRNVVRTYYGQPIAK